jgi:nucleoid DNA-binding protein
MTNRDFVKHIMKAYPGTVREDIRKMVCIVFQCMRSALVTGESLSIPDLGTFSPEFVEQRGKSWKNPLTGEIQELQDKVRLRFRASKRFEKHLTGIMLGIPEE